MHVMYDRGKKVRNEGLGAGAGSQQTNITTQDTHNGSKDYITAGNNICKTTDILSIVTGKKEAIKRDMT